MEIALKTLVFRVGHNSLFSPVLSIEYGLWSSALSTLKMVLFVCVADNVNLLYPVRHFDLGVGSYLAAGGQFFAIFQRSGTLLPCSSINNFRVLLTLFI